MIVVIKQCVLYDIPFIIKIKASLTLIIEMDIRVLNYKKNIQSI